MTAVAVHLLEQRLALRELVGVLEVILALLRMRGDRRAAAGRQGHHRVAERRFRARWVGADVADLALTGGKRQQRGRDDDGSRDGPSRALHACTVPLSADAAAITLAPHPRSELTNVAKGLLFLCGLEGHVAARRNPAGHSGELCLACCTPPRLEMEALRLPPLAGNGAADAELVRCDKRHEAFDELIDHDIRFDALDERPVEITRPDEFDVARRLGERGGECVAALQRKQIAENQNFLFLRAGSCVEITHMRPDVNLRSEFRRFQIAGDGIAINPFRFHPEIIKFSGLIDWWIQLAAHVEHAVDRLVRARQKIWFRRQADALAKQAIGEVATFAAPVRVGFEVLAVFVWRVLERLDQIEPYMAITRTLKH